jgi:hypothetical protein
MTSSSVVSSSHAEQHPQGGGLAGAIRAEEAGDATGMHRGGETVDSEGAAEALGQPLEPQRRPHGADHRGSAAP